MLTREQSCRRSDWCPGRPFRFPGDDEGSVWDLPIPTMDLGIRPQVDLEDNQHFGRAFAAKQADLRRWFREKPERIVRNSFHYARAVLPLVEDCLLRNYALSRSDVLDLVMVIPRDEPNEALWSSLTEHALGIGPRTPERWMRLAFLSRSGASGLVYQEDAQDLAQIISVPPFEVVKGQVVPLAIFPARADWVDEERPVKDPNESVEQSATLAYFLRAAGF